MDNNTLIGLIAIAAVLIWIAVIAGLRRVLTPKRYFIWFLAAPIVGCFVIQLAAQGRLEDKPIWAQVIVVFLIVPLAVNLFFGPTIYAFWKRKKSRVTICVLNVLCAFVGATPGLLLWIWALRGKTEEES